MGAPKPKPWAKPRRKPSIPAPSGVRISDVPEALMPADPGPASALTKVGDVCGQEIWARTDLVEKAAQIRAAMQKDEGYWPADALHATILALRMGLKPTPSYREIAVMLNMSERHVLRTVRRGKKEARVEQEIARLDREGMPMAVENVLEGLEAKDKEYTLEYMKGRGVFQTKHAPVADQGSAATPFAGLVVQFVHDSNAPKEIRAGAITATPNRALAPAQLPTSD
jgi:hypothetical protein